VIVYLNIHQSILAMGMPCIIWRRNRPLQCKCPVEYYSPQKFFQRRHVASDAASILRSTNSI